MMKRIFSLLLALTMMLSLCASFATAAESAVLMVKAGDIIDGKVDVTVDLSDNPGIAALGFTLNYDNTKLVPETYEKYSVLGAGNCVSNFDQGKAMDSYKFATYFFSGTSNSTANGTLLKITFAVKSTDWEETPLTLEVTSGDIADQDYNDVAYSLIDGVVKNSTTNVPPSDDEPTDEPALTVNPGKVLDGEVEVTVDLTNNPGIAALGFTLNYDNTKLVPKTYEKYSVLGSGNCVSNFDQNKPMDSYKFATYFFSGTSNSTANGTLLKITFAVNGTDWDETPLTLEVTSGDIADQDYNDVEVALVNGVVENSTTIVPPSDDEPTDKPSDDEPTDEPTTKAALTVNPGKVLDGEVEVTVDLTNNPGIAALGFTLNYDNTKLVPKTYEKYSVLGAGNCVSNFDQGKAMDSYEFATYFFSGTSNSTANGTLLKITFAVKSTDWDETPLTLEVASGDIADQDYNDVEVSLVNAVVKNTAPIVPPVEENKDFENITFKDKTCTYNGEEQTIEISGTLPEGATVDYTNANGKNVGTYKAKAVIKADGYNTLTLNAKMVITPAPITIKAKDVEVKVGDALPKFDENSYEITEGRLFGDDKIEGSVATDCRSTNKENVYTIKKGTLKVSANYELTFVEGKLSVIDKTPQKIVVSEIVPTTYGADSFRVEVTPDATSGLKEITFESSNKNVAEVAEDGTVTIKGAGKTNIIVKQAGNDEYAAFEKSQELVVNKAKIVVKAKDVIVRIGDALPKFDENSYEITEGKLFGDDKLTGSVTTDCKSTAKVKDYKIKKGDLTAGNNYDLTFIEGKLSVMDKTPQTIVVADVPAKTYGDASFKLEVTADEVSKLDVFTYVSNNAEVAEVAEDGTVTIKGAGEATITVEQAGNDEYAKATKEVKIVVEQKAVVVKSVDIGAGEAVLEGVLDADKDSVALNFAKLRTSVVSFGEVTMLKVTNFVLKGDKAKNYVVTNEDFMEVEVESEEVSENLTEDENVTIEASFAGDKVVVVTSVAVAPEAEVKDVVIDTTTIEDKKVDTVAVSKDVVDAILEIGEDATLEIALKGDEDKNSSVVLDSKALAAVSAEAEMLSVSVAIAEENELTTEQNKKYKAVENKTPVVYSLGIVDEEGNYVSSDFGDGKAIVTLPYVKSARGTIYVKHLDNDGTLTTISNPKYDAEKQLVTVTLKHFSEYLIYTEPQTTSGGGGGGGGGGAAVVTKYTVDFETNGGTAIASASVSKNSLVNAPAVPVKDGFKFEGWYTDSELTNAYDFATKVTQNFTLYAKWTEAEATEGADVATGLAFKDVKASDWYYENVKYVVENNLMNGLSADKFAPNNTLTRAMLVTVLYRNAGEPATNRSIPFGDVDMGAYYANAVLWAKQNGIVNGVTETKFAPDQNITREQIAAIMFRYAQYKGMEAVTLEENLHFADSNKISEYAVSAMNWAVGAGLMNGKTATTINPKDNATRAEIAAILQRFIESNK